MGRAYSLAETTNKPREYSVHDSMAKCRTAGSAMLILNRIYLALGRTKASLQNKKDAELAQSE